MRAFDTFDFWLWTFDINPVYLKLKVHPSSKEDKIIQNSSDSFEIYVRAKPVDGKASEAALRLLGEFLHVPRSKLRLLRGATSRSKIVEMLD